MKNSIVKLVCVGSACILLLCVAIYSMHILPRHRLRRYAEKVREPFYTLVVNGKIVEHTHTVHFDRYSVSSDGLWEGYMDGRVEVPLLTVLNAMGATCSQEECGSIVIEYGGERYILVPERQAIYPEGTDLLEDFTASNQQQWDERNLLLIWDEKTNGYFREDHGEYIVDLGSLHKLALQWKFTFDFDCERGIVSFYSNSSKDNSPPAH